MEFALDRLQKLMTPVHLGQEFFDMTFQSILFRTAHDRRPGDQIPAPDFFVDLALDQIVAAVTAPKEEYDLKPFFHAPLQDADAVLFRQEVMRDLENPSLFDDIRSFAESMRAMRKDLALAEGSHYRHEKERWQLDAAGTYCDAVTRLAEDLTRSGCASRGLQGFLEYLDQYTGAKPFISLRDQTKKLKADLASVRYGVLINGLTVQVRRYEDEPNYDAEIETSFENFRQGAVKEYAFQFYETGELNHVEVSILERVAQLYPEIFSELEAYCARFKAFPEQTITTFDREIQFYLAYLEHIAPFRDAGLAFCYPRISREEKEIYDYQGFDLALAGKLLRDEATPVCNDFHLRGPERIIVVSGPNQGGKTTFARTFGQLHTLAALGCPVPGSEARLFLCDRLFTHFEREEEVANLQGKLQDDLVRMHAILETATPQSLVVINEIFASTTFRDAAALSRKIAAQLMELDLLCVWVTFIDELASLSEKTVSMISTVVPENPAERTYEIVRQPANGLAYAMAIAEKYRLTQERIKERIGP